eukprot:8033416-Pyramimonas_sp.AAC.1
MVFPEVAVGSCHGADIASHTLTRVAPTPGCRWAYCIRKSGDIVVLRVHPQRWTDGSKAACLRTSD